MDSVKVPDGNCRAATLLKRFKILTEIRPSALSSALLKLLAPEERRGIVSTLSGLRIYADPFTHFGRRIVTNGSFEPETEDIFRTNLSPGGTFLDIGANEGYFSALAGSLVGPNGVVIAVEPQDRLKDIIEINLRLNSVERYRIYANAFGGDDGAEGIIHLWPTQNTGASSIVRPYRFNRGIQKFRFISLDRILRECEIENIDFVKVDVEGFEAEVVHHMVPHLRAGRIKLLFLDYHGSILKRAGIDPLITHHEILHCGYSLVSGDAKRLDSYHLYGLSK